MSTLAEQLDELDRGFRQLGLELALGYLPALRAMSILLGHDPADWECPLPLPSENTRGYFPRAARDRIEAQLRDRRAEVRRG